MKKFLFVKVLIVLSVVFFNSDVLNGSEPVAISLGRNCAVAAVLRLYNLRNDAYPFDWLWLNNPYKTIYNLILNDFRNFLKSDKLVKYKNGVKDIYNDIIFMHDFPTLDDKVVPNFLSFLPEIKKSMTGE